MRDYEDSKRTTKDANIVLGLYEPQRHMKEGINLFKGYDITILRSWIRTLHILKNRNSDSNRFVPLRFLGAVGSFEQLPEPKDMTEELYTQLTKY
jgi:hypothetical protein